MRPLRDEIAKERFLDILHRNPDMSSGNAAVLAVAGADALMKELQRVAHISTESITATATGLRKACKACYGSGGKILQPCEVCNGSGKVKA